jgi:hypothetical protein
VQAVFFQPNFATFPESSNFLCLRLGQTAKNISNFSGKRLTALPAHLKVAASLSSGTAGPSQ